jgi:TM2 domain-containing membrane protein YozV
MESIASSRKQKKIGIVIVLAMMPGIFGLMGIGHMYIGRIARGIAIFLVGLILILLAIVRFQYSAMLGTLGYSHLATTIYATSIVDLAIWGWQIYDAYNLAMEYNRIVQETGEPPW